jgi:hypothetical protein
MRVRDCVAYAGPADLEEMPSRRRGRGLAVDHQHLEFRERLETTTWHHVRHPGSDITTAHEFSGDVN